MSNILFIVMYGIAETSLVLCGATTAIYLLIFCVYLVVNRTLQEFKNDKNIQKVWEYPKVCVNLQTDVR